MSLRASISEDMKAAMKAREPQRLSAIRLLLAAIKQREVLAVGSLELRNGIAALLDHLLDDRHHFCVGKLFPLVDFALLDRCEQQAYGREALRLPRFHSCLHVFADAGP